MRCLECALVLIQKRVEYDMSEKAVPQKNVIALKLKQKKDEIMNPTYVQPDGIPEWEAELGKVMNVVTTTTRLLNEHYITYKEHCENVLKQSIKELVDVTDANWAAAVPAEKKKEIEPLIAEARKDNGVLKVEKQRALLEKFNALENHVAQFRNFFLTWGKPRDWGEENIFTTLYKDMMEELDAARNCAQTVVSEVAIMNYYIEKKKPQAAAMIDPQSPGPLLKVVTAAVCTAGRRKRPVQAPTERPA